MSAWLSRLWPDSAFSSIDRQAGNSDSLASSGLSSLLALEEPWPRTTRY